MRVLSVTQLFEFLAMIDYEGAKEEVLQWKSELGVAVHRALELLATNTLDWDTVDDAAMPYIIGGETWIKAMQVTVVSQEFQGIMTIHGMKVGFRYDAIIKLMYRGRMRWAILEYKNTVKASPTWKIQTAAYVLAAPKLPDGEQYLRIALQLKPDGPAVPHYYEDQEDVRAFAHFLYVGIWKLNNGYKLK